MRKKNNWSGNFEGEPEDQKDLFEFPEGTVHLQTSGLQYVEASGNYIEQTQVKMK